MSHHVIDLKRFLDSAPTSWHAAREIGNRLALQGYTPLSEIEPWKLESGKNYFIQRGGAVCAFMVPKNKPKQALILASHTDSPGLKLKPHPISKKENMLMGGVEVYGSPLLTSWLNRDLILAGRVMVSVGEGVEERLVILDDAILSIPQLAIHLDREVNEKGLLLNKQDHLPFLLGLTESEQKPLEAIEKLLRRHLSFQELLSYELFVVPHEKSAFIGLEGELLASYRIDNLATAHAALSALASLKTPSSETLNIALFWDHEEIGSHTTDGAGSPLLSDLLMRICSLLGLNEEERFIFKNQSLCLSLDMTHGFNPNYAQKLDSQHQPLLGKGIVLKHNANHRYATDAPSAAVIVHACKKLGLPYQTFVARSDMSCGSTVGPIMAERSGISCVDLGCAQLSMHSIREVMATCDYTDLYRLLCHLLQESE